MIFRRHHGRLSPNRLLARTFDFKSTYLATGEWPQPERSIRSHRVPTHLDAAHGRIQFSDVVRGQIFAPKNSVSSDVTQTEKTVVSRDVSANSVRLFEEMYKLKSAEARDRIPGFHV